MKKLFFYGVKQLDLNGYWIVKPGQTVQETKEAAEQYALNETFGKLKAKASKDNIIYCIDVTSKADQDIANGLYKGSAPYYEKYDDFARDQIKKSDIHTGYHRYTLRNELGGGSRELHTYENQNITSEQLDDQWIRLINEFVTGSKNKANFAPRKMCQEPAIETIADYILSLEALGILKLNRSQRRFLLNGKMRFGKCFVTYKSAKRAGYNKILILTYKPGGVAESWEEDLDHVDFDGARFSLAKDMDSVKFDDNFEGMQVIFASFQDAIGEDGDKAKWQEIKNQLIDLVVIDETHYGSDTPKATDFLSSLNSKFELHLSGTPFKALTMGKFDEKQIYHWSYMDEQLAKKNWDYSNGPNPYEYMPTLNLILMKYDKEFMAKWNKQYTEEEKPTMSKIFAKQPLADLFLDKFVSRGGILVENELQDKDGKSKKYNINHGFYLLPDVASCNMAEKVMRKNPNFDGFEIINVAGDGVNRIEEVKQSIEKSNKSIVLSCKRFDTGSTVKQWDYVVMLTNIHSAETYWQSAFRPGTPWSDGDKKDIYVFDYDYNRVLEVTGDYAKALSDNSPKEMTTIVREMLDTMPIYSLGNAIETNIDVKAIMEAYNQDKSDNFASARLFEESEATEDVVNYLHDLNETNSFKSSQALDEDAEENGKTYNSSNSGKKVELTKKEKNNLVAKARTITIMIPYITYLNDTIKCVADLDDHSDLFEEITGKNLEGFKMLLQTGFIDREKLNEAIAKMNHEQHYEEKYELV